MGHTESQKDAFTLAGSSGPVPTLPSFRPLGPGPIVHQEVTELIEGVGPSTFARTGGTLVGQLEAEGIGPLRRKRLCPTGVQAQVKGGEEYRP